MPPRKRVTLPDHVRNAVLSDLALTKRRATEAEEDFKVRIYLGVEQGLDTYELAEELGLSQSAVSKYRGQGQAILERREKERGEFEPTRDRPAGDDPV